MVVIFVWAGTDYVVIMLPRARNKYAIEMAFHVPQVYVTTVIIIIKEVKYNLFYFILFIRMVSRQCQVINSGLNNYKYENKVMWVLPNVK